MTLTLSELTTLTGANVYYLFNFISDDTQESILFTAPDVSPNPIRYNRFLITETGSTYINLTGGTIHLSTPGYYHYDVYQMTGKTNVSLSGVSGPAIESGKMLVSGTSLSVVIDTYTGGTSIDNNLYIFNN